MTQIIKSLSDWRTLRHEMIGTIGFVPTMGNLHDGHKSLLHRSIQENQQTVLSIFVNPTQFDDPKDFENYPHTLDIDLIEAEKLAVNWVLVPAPEEIYPDHYAYRIVETTPSSLSGEQMRESVRGESIEPLSHLSKSDRGESIEPLSHLSDRDRGDSIVPLSHLWERGRGEGITSHVLCGAHRPGHFEGMLTVVLKWLLLVNPTRAYFGEKDFQQFELVREMARAFFLDVEIIPCETIRDKNGLALSSRNARLSPEAYELAIEFPSLLQSSLSPQAIRAKLEQLGFVVEYIEEYQGRRFGAVQVGGVRLIDNFRI